MALLDKLRHSFGHRWMLFFLPVVASLLYVLLVILFIPDHLLAGIKANGDDDNEKSGSAALSAAKPADSAARATRRKARVTARTPSTQVGVGAPAVRTPLPAAVPASPDGNE